MDTRNISIVQEQIQTILWDLERKLEGLSADRRAQIAEDVQKIRDQLVQLPPGSAPAKEMLDEEGRILRLFVEYAPAAIAMLDRNMVYIAASRRYLIDYNLGDVNIVGRSHYEIFPEIPERWKQIHRRCLAGQVEKCSEDPFPRSDGRLDWVRWEIHPWHEASGEIGGIILFSEVITARKEVDEALKTVHAELLNERNRLLALMDALPIGVAILDRNGGILNSNQGYSEVWGTPRPVVNSVDDYAAFRAWWIENGKPVLPEEWASARAVQKGETIIGQMMGIQRFDGKHAYILNSGAPIYDAQGEIAGCAIAIMDITSLRQAEQAMYESELRFRVALSALDMIVFTLDRDLRYIWVSKPHLGVPAQQVLGKRDDEIYPGNLAVEFMAAERAVIDTGQRIQREVKILLDGGWKYFLLAMEPMLDMEENISGLVGVSMDVTEQRQNEVRHRETMMRMEVQQRLLEYREQERQLLARELHDGPLQDLSGLIFNVQFTRDTISDMSIQLEMDAILTGLKNTVQDLRGLMNELRPPSLIRFGLTQTLHFYLVDFRERHPELEMDFALTGEEDHLSEEVRLNLFRILQEALNNIIKHARASRISIYFDCSEQEIRLDIHDNGQGFKVSKNLVDYTEKDHFGLVGMNERAEAMGGKLVLSTAPGQGTHLQISIPVAVR